MNLQGKTIVLGITGSIAAYKAAELVSSLRKCRAEVYVIMTKSACEFIAPLTLETLSGHPVVSDMFARVTSWDVEHISLAKRADVFAVVPASANILGKAANGIADDMLSTTLLATKAPILFAPAMNTNMYENPAVQDNIATLKTRGAYFVEPADGHLACGDSGKGKLAEVGSIEQAIADLLTPKDCAGLSVLVTAGPTREALDPVRFLSNHSTGKMGYALAERARARGAQVTLVTGPTMLQTPPQMTVVPVISAREMRDAVMCRLAEQDLVIKAAAVGDYRPAEMAQDKLKKKDEDMRIELVRNPDILQEIGQNKRANQTVCGFAMETRDLVAHAREKMQRKHCDMMVANNLKTAGAGFAHDTNVVTLLYADGQSEALDLMYKEALADLLLDRLLALHRQKAHD